MKYDAHHSGPAKGSFREKLHEEALSGLSARPVQNKYHLHLSPIYHLLHYARCPLLLLITFPLAMLTSCAEEGAPEKCSLNVISPREWRLGNDTVAWLFVLGYAPCDSVPFPLHLWLLSRRLAGGEWKSKEADWRGLIQRKLTFQAKIKHLFAYCIRWQPLLEGVREKNNLSGSV